MPRHQPLQATSTKSTVRKSPTKQFLGIAFVSRLSPTKFQNKTPIFFLEWFSYCAGYQPLNHSTTPFSTSWKVLQSYDHFLNLPNFFRKKNLRNFCSKTMWFAGQKYPVYGSKLPWFQVKTMGVTVAKLRGYAKATQDTTDYGQQSGGSRLIAHRSFVNEVQRLLSVDGYLQSLNPKFDIVSPASPPYPPVFPLIGEYLRGILEWWRTEVLTSRRFWLHRNYGLTELRNLGGFADS